MSSHTYRRGLKPLGYVLVLFFLYLVAFPFDKAAANGLPLTPGLQFLVAATIGGLLLMAAHFAADKQQDYEDARELADEHPEKFRTERNWYYAALVGPIVAIVGIGAWRYFTFEEQAEMTGGLFAGGAMANVVFTMLALVAFVAAFIAGQKYLWLKPLRDCRKQRELNRGKRRIQQEIIDRVERVQAQAALTLQYLDETEANYIAQVNAWRETRKDVVMHKARMKEHTQRAKQFKRDYEDPGPGAGARQPRPERRPTPGGGSAPLRAIEIDDLADEVQAKARAQGLS